MCQQPKCCASEPLACIKETDGTCPMQRQACSTSYLTRSGQWIHAQHMACIHKCRKQVQACLSNEDSCSSSPSASLEKEALPMRPRASKPDAWCSKEDNWRLSHAAVVPAELLLPPAGSEDLSCSITTLYIPSDSNVYQMLLEDVRKTADDCEQRLYSALDASICRSLFASQVLLTVA